MSTLSTCLETRRHWIALENKDCYHCAVNRLTTHIPSSSTFRHKPIHVTDNKSVRSGETFDNGSEKGSIQQTRPTRYNDSSTGDHTITPITTLASSPPHDQLRHVYELQFARNANFTPNPDAKTLPTVYSTCNGEVSEIFRSASDAQRSIKATSRTEMTDSKTYESNRTDTDIEDVDELSPGHEQVWKKSTELSRKMCSETTSVAKIERTFHLSPELVIP